MKNLIRQNQSGMGQRDRRRETESISENSLKSTHQISSTDKYSQMGCEIIFALERYNTVVVERDLRSKVPLRLPSLLCAAGWTSTGENVLVAVPKNVVAIGAAVQVANENGLDESHLGGDYVGFALHTEVKRSSKTQIVYYSNTSLLGRILTDPLLDSVCTVILGSFHERSVHVDLLALLLKRIQRTRSDLRIVVATALNDGSRIRSFFGTSTSTVVSMRSEIPPVIIRHIRSPAPDYLIAALEVVKDCFSQWNQIGRPVGMKLLIFAATGGEANSLCAMINEWYMDSLSSLREVKKGDLGFVDRRAKHRGLIKSALLSAYPLHSEVGVIRQQSALLENCDLPYMIAFVSASINEIDSRVRGISTVVDCGYEKMAFYDTHSKMVTLSTVPISCATADMRAFRANVGSPGICYRLYTQQYMKVCMPKYRSPPILRSEISQAVGVLKAVGVADLTSADFLDRPSEQQFVDALERLYHLGSFNDRQQLTTKMRAALSSMSLSSQMERSIEVGESYGVEREIAAVAAMLDVEQVLFRTDRHRTKLKFPFCVSEGDLLTLLNVWRQYVARGRSDAWCDANGINAGAMKRASRCFARIVRMRLRPQSKESKFNAARNALGLTIGECVCRSIAAGYFENTAKVEPQGSYLIALSGVKAVISSSSVLHKRMPKWLVYTGATHGRDNHYEIGNITVVKPEWIVLHAQDVFHFTGCG